MRVIASTNRDLLQLVAEGKFREDLYYRLHVVSLTIPPLRERMGDIALLADYFVEKYNRAFGMQVSQISSKGLKQLKRYQWPGNARQLESVIESAMNRIPPGASKLEDYFQLNSLAQNKQNLTSLKDKIEQIEADTIRSTLNANEWDIGLTAKQLDISTASLYRKIKKYNL